jgi:hypothetical protein
MANPLRGQATFEHDGETLTFSYTNEAFCLVEKVTGVSFFDTIEAIQKAEADGLKPKITDMRALLWGGLQEYQPKFPLLQAGDMILRGETPVLTAMMEALNGAMPKAAEETPANPPKKGRAGTGSN